MEERSVAPVELAEVGCGQTAGESGVGQANDREFGGRVGIGVQLRAVYVAGGCECEEISTSERRGRNTLYFTLWLAS